MLLLSPILKIGNLIFWEEIIFSSDHFLLDLFYYQFHLTFAITKIVGNAFLFIDLQNGNFNFFAEKLRF